MEEDAECSSGTYPPIYEECRNDEKTISHVVDSIAYENTPPVHPCVDVVCGSFVVMVHIRKQTMEYFKKHDTSHDGSGSKCRRPAFMERFSYKVIRENGKNASRERCKVREASLHPRTKRLMGEHDADERCEHDAYGGESGNENQRHMF